MDNSKNPIQQQGLPDGIPTTEEAERSELSERLDRQIIEDHLSEDIKTDYKENEEPGAPS